MSVAFWSVQLKAGKPVEVQPPEGYVLNLQLASLHGESEKCGVVKVDTMAIEGDPLTAVIATLRSKTADQFNLNLVFGYDVATKFTFDGDKSSTVYLSGYFQPAPEDMGSDDEFGEEEESDSDEGSDDEKPTASSKAAPSSAAPSAKPVLLAKPVPAKADPAKAVPAKADPAKTVPVKAVPAKAVPAKDKLVVEDVDNSDEEDSEDEDDDSVDEEFIQKMIAQNRASGGDDDSEEDSDEEEEEDSDEEEEDSESEEEPPKKIQKAAPAKPVHAQAQAQKTPQRPATAPQAQKTPQSGFNKNGPKGSSGKPVFSNQKSGDKRKR